MKDNTDKYIKELLKDIKTESPSGNFTQNVMNQIIAEEKNIVEAKVPFIKKYKFMIIFSLTFISIFIIGFFFFDYHKPMITDEINFIPAELSFFEKLRDFFSVDIQFSIIHLIIVVSVFMLFALDFFIPKITKIQKNINSIL